MTLTPGASPALPTGSLVDLAQSFLDLWHHSDSVEARRYDSDGPLPALRPFDKETVRQHAAAFRALEGAILELDLATLDEEIDRTILLAAIRPQIRRLDRDHPERSNPVFWTDRLVSVLDARPGDPATLAALPGWVDDARATVTTPPFAFLEVALDDVAAARTSLARPEWWLGDKEGLSQAAAALDRLEQFFRHETMPDPGATGGGGADAVSWHLHHAALVEVGGTEAARRLAARLEVLRRDLEGRGQITASRVDLSGAVEAYRQGLRHQGSLIRRRITSPVWLQAFALFALGARADHRDREGALVATFLRTHLGRLDLEIQLGTKEPGAALADPSELGTSVVRRPLEATMVALLTIEWEATRAGWPGDTATFLAAVLKHGILHPTLAAWRLGQP